MSLIKENLILGGYKEAENDIKSWYKSLQVSSILCVASEFVPPNIELMNIKHIPIIDDDPSENLSLILPQTIAFVKNELENGNKVLVHCRSGASRAACVILAILIELFNYTLIDAYYYVLNKRPQMNIFPPFLDQLQRIYREN